MARKHQAWAMMGVKKVIARGMLRNSSLRFFEWRQAGSNE
jgi:hypothetical protein